MSTYVLFNMLSGNGGIIQGHHQDQGLGRFLF